MFDQLKAMSAMAGLMKNKQAMADAARSVHESLDKREISVEAPDKSICVKVNGKLTVTSISLHPRVVADAAASEAQRAAMEQLICRAVNAALSRAKDAIAEEIGAEAKKLGLGDLGSDIGGGLGQLLK